MIPIYRQEIIQDIRLFTSQPVTKFYDDLFLYLDLSMIPEYPRTGRKGYSAHAMICAFIVMKCEGFSMITDLLDYLTNNLIIAHFCGFDIRKPLPSYWSFDRFLKNFDHELLTHLMKDQVSSLARAGLIDASFIGLDSTPVFANTLKNNPKSFLAGKFNPQALPKADKDCKLGVHTASNQTGEKKTLFYWGYKNHVLTDCITGLPIYETTTTANVADSTVTLDLLAEVHAFLPLSGCSFLADKGYDVKSIYNSIHRLYQGECFIPLNRRNSKQPDMLASANLLCDAGLAMHKDGKTSDAGRTRQKFCCPFRLSKKASCPCSHKNFFNGKKNRGCTKYVTIPNDLRLSINRDSKRFKTTYSLRSECERYNARFKASGQERLWVRNQDSAANLNTLAHISLLAVAVASISTGKQFYRKLKSLKRIA